MQVIEEIKQKLQETFEKLGYPTELVSLSFSDRPELCDFQSNSAFALAKVLKNAPIKIAENIAQELKSDNFKVEVCAPGFINISLNEGYLTKILNDFATSEKLLTKTHKQPKTIIIDYGGPNVAKPLHVGHLRSAILGETVKRIAKFMGDNVISDVHLGDWGLQMGLTIAGLEEEFDLSYYFKNEGKKPDITMEDLNRIYPAASARSKTDEEFKKYLLKTRAMCVDMEAATLFTTGFYNHIPTGALLLVSDQPMIPEGVKTEKSDSIVTQHM